MSMMNEGEDMGVMKYTFDGDELDIVQAEGEYWLVLTRLCELFEIKEPQSQLDKLKELKWATSGSFPVVGRDGKVRPHTCINIRSVNGWLFTLNRGWIAEHLHEKLTRYQRKCADVLADHFLGKRGQTSLARVTPEAASLVAANDTERQLRLLLLRQKGAIEIYGAITGLYGDDFLRNKVEHAVAIMTGAAPAIANPLLSVDGYLTGRGLSRGEIKSKSPIFGKKLKALYRAEHGVEPPKQPREVNHSDRMVYSYTEADRPLFDRIFTEMFPELDLAEEGDEVA